MPTRSIPALKTSEPIAPIGDVTIVGCEKYQAQEYELDCESKSADLAGMLEGTKLFSRVLKGDHEADYLIELKPYSRYPYQFSIGHNPGILLLSIAAPFWESREYGYNFTISRFDEGKAMQVNTIEQGTFLMWSGSIFINMLPYRGIPGTFHENEVTHLRNTIINTLMQ